MSVLGSSKWFRAFSAALSVLACSGLCARAAAQATASFPEAPSEEVERTSRPEPPKVQWADSSVDESTPIPQSPPPPAPTPARSTLAGVQASPLSVERTSMQAASMENAFASESVTRSFATLPYRLPYEDGDPVPQGYRIDESSERSLATVGGVLLGAGYLLGVVVAASDDAGSQWMYVPVAGPFAAIASRDVVCGDMTSDPQGAQDACVDRVSGEARFLSLALASGLLQVSGATLFVIGMNQSEQTLVPQTGAQLEPRVGTSEVGLDFTGRF